MKHARSSVQQMQINGSEVERVEIEKSRSSTGKKRRKSNEKTLRNLPLPSGDGDGIVEDHLGVMQDVIVKDLCSVDARQKKTGISLPADAKNFPRRPRSERGFNMIPRHSFEEGHAILVHKISQGHARPQRKSSKKAADDFNDFEEFLSHHRRGSCHRGQARKRWSSNDTIIKRDKQLDSGTFQQCLEYLWQSFPEEKKKLFITLDSLWYTLYMDKSHKEKVLNWVRKKDIFSRKYVILPVVQAGHWNLMILCHFGENPDSKTTTPCILLLDSLGNAEPKRLEPERRRFVLDMYRADNRPVNEKLFRKIPFLVPQVPQQRNGEECGFYVLYYINLFVNQAPDNFSASEGYPYFMKKDWFTVKDLDDFCRTLDPSCE